MENYDLSVIGGGLAGTEAAWQAARSGLKVRLYEMRPFLSTGAHKTSNLAELVCSNSLGSSLPDRASGVLKNELRLMGSLLLECAEVTAVPAGTALAVDRDAFSILVTERIMTNPNIELVRKEVSAIPSEPVIIASGPLTSNRLSASIASFTGENQLYFYDAIAPIITEDSIDMDIAFRASRYGAGEKEDGDYINCPFTREEYDQFVITLINADRIRLRDFETRIESGVKAGADSFFEGCLPVEILARRGGRALSFGPMRPTGLADPRSGQRPYALVQLRQDNLAGSLFNLVGFQTNLTFSEQKRVFRTIPGLENAEFVRFGQMHRNTYLEAPKILLPTLQHRRRSDLFFAGQITGVEGYMGNIGTGLLAGINAVRLLRGLNPFSLPRTTILGSLCDYISNSENKNFQPMKANFGLLPPIDSNLHLGKRDRARLFSERAISDLSSCLSEIQMTI
jgi:methylenetetrahydrofolate--tRNA-(uracil-5-)-methyltransferase